MGRPKALVRYRGELLVERACRLLADAGCAPVLAVLGAGAEDVLTTARLPVGTATVTNPDHRLVDAWWGGAVAAQATYRGEPGHPVLLSRAVLAAVAATATGDRGARDWLRAHAELVVRVPCDDTGYPSDLDTPDDLAAAPSAAGEE